VLIYFKIQFKMLLIEGDFHDYQQMYDFAYTWIPFNTFFENQRQYSKWLVGD